MFLKKSRQVIFITGLAGTGKTSLYYHFLENPLKGYAFYDFDFGKYHMANFKKGINELWYKQNYWWLRVAAKEFDIHKRIPVIFGLCMAPTVMKENLDQPFFRNNEIHFGLLNCNSLERKERLKNRDQLNLISSNQDWQEEYVTDLKNNIKFEIDTSSKKVEMVASEIVNHLPGLS